ncbi:MAG: hypothetical protein AAF936_10415 [Pseudomonadota bacterium]
MKSKARDNDYQSRADQLLLETVRVGTFAARMRAANFGQIPEWLDEIDSILMREQTRINDGDSKKKFMPPIAGMNRSFVNL